MSSVEKGSYPPSRKFPAFRLPMFEGVPSTKPTGQNIYTKQPEFYDKAYARFQKNPRLVQLAQEYFSTEGTYLDMASGTGEVSRQLLDSGFNNMYLADNSEEMMRIARQKLPELPDSRFITASFDDMRDQKAYDGILIRQAVNYISPQKLSETFARVRNGLKENGTLIFNSFSPDGLSSGVRPQRRDEVNNDVLVTQEGNLIEGNVIYHGQRTEVFDTETGGYNIVYDLNSFHQYTTADFQAALQEGGFSNISIITEGKSIYALAK